MPLKRRKQKLYTSEKRQKLLQWLDLDPELEELVVPGAFLHDEMPPQDELVTIQDHTDLGWVGRNIYSGDTSSESDNIYTRRERRELHKEYAKSLYNSAVKYPHRVTKGHAWSNIWHLNRAKHTSGSWGKGTETGKMYEDRRRTMKQGGVLDPGENRVNKFEYLLPLHAVLKQAQYWTPNELTHYGQFNNIEYQSPHFKKGDYKQPWDIIATVNRNLARQYNDKYLPPTQLKEEAIKHLMGIRGVNFQDTHKFTTKVKDNGILDLIKGPFKHEYIIVNPKKSVAKTTPYLNQGHRFHLRDNFAFDLDKVKTNEVYNDDDLEDVTEPERVQTLTSDTDTSKDSEKVKKALRARPSKQTQQRVDTIFKNIAQKEREQHLEQILHEFDTEEETTPKPTRHVTFDKRLTRSATSALTTTPAIDYTHNPYKKIYKTTSRQSTQSQSLLLPTLQETRQTHRNPYKKTRQRRNLRRHQHDNDDRGYEGDVGEPNDDEFGPDIDDAEVDRIVQQHREGGDDLVAPGEQNVQQQQQQQPRRNKNSVLSKTRYKIADKIGNWHKERYKVWDKYFKDEYENIQ